VVGGAGGLEGSFGGGGGSLLEVFSHSWLVGWVDLGGGLLRL